MYLIHSLFFYAKLQTNVSPAPKDFQKKPVIKKAGCFNLLLI